MGFGWEGPGRHEPHCNSRDDEVLAQLAALHQQISDIRNFQQEDIMTALSDLQAADSALKAEVAQAISDWTAQLQSAAGDQASVEAVVADMNAQVQALQAQDSAEGGTPAAPAAPASGNPQAS